MRATNGTRKKEPNLDIWEHPKGSRIKVSEIINRTRSQDFGGSFRVYVPARVTGKGRIYRQFQSKEEAFEYAEREFDGKQKHGERHFALSSSQREEAIQAVNLLRGTGISLIESARHAVQHLRPKAGDITVSELVNELLSEKAKLNLRERNIRDLRNRLGIFAEAHGGKLIKEISQADIERWLQGMARLSVRTRKNYRRCVASFFSFAVKREYRSTNPVTNIAVPREDWTAPVILSVKEAQVLIKTAHKTHLKNTEGKYGWGMLPAIALQAFAGLRTTEVAQLDWEAIDLDRSLVTIGSAIAKKRRLRAVDLESNCVEWLRLYERKSGKVAPPNFHKKFGWVVAKAGFQDWRGSKRNSLRHSFGTYLYASSQDANRTAAALGHAGSDVVLFDCYRSLAAREDGEAFFSITPESTKQTVVPFPKVAG